jgi:putative transposase
MASRALKTRVWVLGFVRWYNNDHRHSGIKFVTPSQRHDERDINILAARKAVYKQAKNQNSDRWRAQTRNWDRPG